MIKNDSVYIYFTSSNAWYSRFLRWAEKSKVSHVGIEYYSKDFFGVWALEACSKGIICIPVSNSRKGVVRRFQCLFDTKYRLRDISLLVGRPYDYKGAFILGAYHFFKRAITNIKKPVYTTEEKKCSELLIKFLEGKPGIDSIDPEWATPQDILDYCIARKRLFKEVANNGV
jgi:hypothetical protein